MTDIRNINTPNSLDKLIKKLPKAELHVHLEGTLTPELMLQLAKKNNITLPYATSTEIRAAYQFPYIQQFFDKYYEGCKVLIKQSDFYMLTLAYLQRAYENNIRHVEIAFDPQIHTDRGVHFSTIMEGILDALEEGRTLYNISSRLILNFSRHLSEESAFQTLTSAKQYYNFITAIGLSGYEIDNPPKKFQAVFTQARQAGYFIVAHAGETGSADYITQALDLLKACRINHGIHCIDDAALTTRLIDKKIPLNICPLSNVALKIVDGLRQHNIKQLLNQGLLVTVNSDCPAYFNAYLNDNYNALANILAFTEAEIIQLIKNSFTASFLDKDTQKSYLQEIDQLVTATTAPIEEVPGYTEESAR